MMRKNTLLFVLIAVLFTHKGFSQLQEVKVEPRVLIGEFRNGPNFAKLERDGTLCYLMFRDESYTYLTDIKMITFNDDQEDLDTLYAAMKELMAGPVDANKRFMLGENRIYLAKSSTFGMSYLYVGTGGGNFTLTKKGIDKLFGKR